MAEGYLRVVLADEARALRDQQGFSGRAVIDVFCHLGGYWARQVGAQPGDQRGRNHRASLQHIGTSRRLHAIGAGGSPIDVPVQEGELVILGSQIA